MVARIKPARLPRTWISLRLFCRRLPDLRGRSIRTSLVAVFLLLCLTGCALGFSDPVRTIPPASTSTPAEYRLGPGDQVRINVFNQANLSGDFVVDGGGFVALPLVGPVEANGWTQRELEVAIANALTSSNLLIDPSVTVQIVQFRPFYILGEVSSPGAYPFTTGLTVRNAVAAARGFTYRANTRRVYIQHAGERDEHLYELTPSTPVSPGDTIRIPERLF
jgi:polysaccharide export outer membrane protein